MMPCASEPFAAPAASAVRRAANALALGLVLLAAGACTLVNGPSNEPAPRPTPPEAERPEPVSREFGGQFSVQGTTFPVALYLVLRGEEVERARLTVPELSMEALGDGELRDGRLTLELEYGDECAGDVRIAGEVEGGGQVFQGTLTAHDCTGDEEGALVLRLRSENGAPTGFAASVVESFPR